MKYFLIIVFAVLISNSSKSQGTLIGGRCEGCEAVFEFGDKDLKPKDTLPDFDTKGQKIKLQGVIYKNDGITPAEGVILYVYHTDEEGVYPTKGGEQGWARRHGYIRGWIKTGADGRYTIYTQKPGSYSDGPAHVHATILEPDGRYYWISSYLFEGDPNISDEILNYEGDRGGNGIIRLETGNDMLTGSRDIILGKEVTGY